MKTHPLMLATILMAALGLALPTAIIADEDGRKLIKTPAPTKEATLKFYAAHAKQVLPIFDTVREFEGDEAYDIVLEEAAERILEYEQIKREDGEEMADLFFEEVRLGMEIHALVFKYHEIDEDEDEQGETMEALREKLAEQLQHALKTSKAELEWLNEEAAALEEEIEELSSNTEEAVEEELEELLFGEDEEEDEESGEDE